MATFTSKATGNWNASGQTTWNEVGVPGNGDTTSITHTVTVNVNTTVGSSPASGGTAAIAVSGSGQLIVATGVTLVARGDITLANAPMTMNAGAILEFDASAASSPSSQHYKLQAGMAGYQHSIVTISGSSGSHCTIRSNSGGGNGYLTDGGTNSSEYVITYCDFTRVGYSGQDGFVGSGKWGCDLQHCVFDTGGGLSITDNFNATIIGRFLNVTTKNTATSTSLNISASAVLTSGTRLVDTCVFDKDAIWSKAVNFTVQHCVFKSTVNVINDDANGGWTFTDNLIYNASNVSIFKDGASASYFLQDPTSQDHYLSIIPDFRDTAFDGCIFENTGTTTTGDCILPGNPANAHTLTVKNCIKLPNSAGTSSGVMVSMGGGANITVVMDHNTMHLGGGTDSSGYRTGEASAGHAGMIASCKNNLGWDTTARGFILCDISSSVTDVVTSANCDYNGKYNTTTGTNGNGYDGLLFSSGSPGAHDVTGGDPGFVASGRDIAAWDTSLGGAGTVANAITELSKVNEAGYNSNYTVSALVSYVKAGFVPTNTAYQAASDSVSPSNGWMGALQGGAVTFIPYTRDRLLIPVAISM